MSDLASQSLGRGEPNLVLLHGFTQTRASWLPIATQMAERHRVTLIDLPGHGETRIRPPSLAAAGRAVAEASGRSVLVGYSMGARIALHAATDPRSEIIGLVLIGAHPGIVDELERRARQASDEELARHLTEVGVGEFLDEWLAQPMFAAVRHLDHHDRLDNTADGLAYVLRVLGTGQQRVLDDDLSTLRVPTLLIVGERDEKFRALAARIHARISGSTVVTIPGAGHACHLERPDATREAIEAWLGSLGDGNTGRK